TRHARTIDDNLKSRRGGVMPQKQECVKTNQIRSTKSEIRNKSEILNPKHETRGACCFGFRVSDFGFGPCKRRQLPCRPYEGGIRAPSPASSSISRRIPVARPLAVSTSTTTPPRRGSPVATSNELG